MRLSLFVLCMMLAGCAPTYRYTHPQFSEAQWKKDRYECKHQASQYYATQGGGATGPAGSGAATLSLLAARASAEHFKECLEARGYTAVPVESSPAKSE